MVDSQGQLNIRSLEKEMSTALESDRRYHKEDDMKKRAITTAATYDDFRNMVACCDLTPVTRKDMDGIAKGPCPQNKPVGLSQKRGYVRRKGSKKISNVSSSTQSPTKPASSSHEFEKFWKCLDQPGKYRYLKMCTPQAVAGLYRVEIDPNILGGIVEVLSAELQQGASVEKLQLSFAFLSHLQETGRFSLNLTFLTKTQTELAKQVFSTLATQFESGDSEDPSMLSKTQALQQKYGWHHDS